MSATTTDRLVEAARAELVATDGELEVARVAARAGVSAGLPYHYFATKAGLLRAVVERFYDAYDAAVMAPNPWPGASWRDRERERTRRFVDFHLDAPLAPVLLVHLARDRSVADAEARRLAADIDRAAANIRSGQRDGELPAHLDADLAAAMTLGGLRQALSHALSASDPLDREHLRSSLWTSVAGVLGLTP